MAEWNTFEEIIEAPGRDKDNRLRLGVSQEFIDTHLAMPRLTPIYQLHAHVLGQLPPINLVSMVNPCPEITTLDDALALFEGIKRPHSALGGRPPAVVYWLRKDENQPDQQVQRVA